MSIARAHMERTLAAKQAAAQGTTPAAGSVPEGRTIGDKMLATLRLHKVELKGLKSRQAKIAAKRDMLPEYDAYVEGVLAAGNGAQDTVLVTVMMWRIDCGLYDQALDIAAYAVRHKLAMPEGWNRDLPTCLLEELAEAALEAPEDAELREALTAAVDLTEGIDMPDEVRAKALKAQGFMVQSEEPARAVDLFEAALALDKNCGVKGTLARLKKSMEATTAADQAAGAGASA